ncbi:MAG: DUF2235 domain-containing protein [Anaerolineae bacterium]|nr:DUF2235 domain-containing protein [Anaerolineae bacterium]
MSKNLVFCSDGTWGRADKRDRGLIAPSNVVKIARALVNDWTSQRVCYDQGIGTRWFDWLTGGIFGIGLSENILDGYRFFVENYSEGDQIYLFGFSRGAFTVRSLAGLIQHSGLVRPEHKDKVKEAYNHYRQKNSTNRFKLTYCWPNINVKFIGVWDTVGALGIPATKLNWIGRKRFAFHDVKLSPNIKYAYQALAIDERRKIFKPALWDVNPCAQQQVEQVWFAGTHANVGGGYVDTGLSDITLEWMITKAKEAGLQFDPEYISRHINPTSSGELRNSRAGLAKILYRKQDRTIAKGSTIHQSVNQRESDATLNYKLALPYPYKTVSTSSVELSYGNHQFIAAYILLEIARVLDQNNRADPSI